MILFEKYGQHQPLNRQRDRYAREGVDLSLSTLADQVGACTVAAEAAARPDRGSCHGGEAPARRRHPGAGCWPKASAPTGRAWVYVRDDRPFGGPDPPAALFRYSRDRSGDHPVEHLKRFTGILPGRHLRRLQRPLCGREIAGAGHRGCMLVRTPGGKFFDLADIAASKRRGKTAPPISPLALEAVKRIVTCCSTSSAGSLAKPPNIALPYARNSARRCWPTSRTGWRPSAGRCRAHSPVAKATDYMLRRWELFARFLDDGRICLTKQCRREGAQGYCPRKDAVGCSPARTAAACGPRRCTR